MEPTVEIVADAALAEADRAVIGRWSEEAFSEDKAFEGFTWAKPTWHVLVRENGQLVSCLKIMDRVSLVGGAPIHMAGIGDVVTPAARRGKGYASLAMREASRYLCAVLGVEFGVLMCQPKLVPFYSRLGYVTVPEPLHFEQPWGQEVSPEITMVKPCGERDWPAGEIDLRGLPW